MKWLCRYKFLLFAIIFYLSPVTFAINDEQVIYNADLYYLRDGVFHGNVSIYIKNFKFDSNKLAFYIHSNSFHKEKNIPRTRLNYLYPQSYFTGDIKVKNFQINGEFKENIKLNQVQDIVKVSIPDNICGELSIKFDIIYSYPSRIGAFGFHNGTLSSIYPPYPLVMLINHSNNFLHLPLAKHDINIHIPDDLTLLGKYKKETRIENYSVYSFLATNSRFISFSILPENVVLTILYVGGTKYHLYHFNKKTDFLSEFLFLMTDISIYYTKTTCPEFKPKDIIIFVPASLEDDLLLLGNGIIYFDEDLLSVPPDYRALVDFNIIRTIMLELLLRSELISGENMLLYLTLCEVLSKDYYFILHKDRPKMPRNILIHSLFMSIDLHNTIEYLYSRYAQAQKIPSLEQSYRFFFRHAKDKYASYNLMSKAQKDPEYLNNIKGLLFECDDAIHIEKKFFDYLNSVNLYNRYNEFRTDTSIRTFDENYERHFGGSGNPLRYALGFEYRPGFLSGFDEQDSARYYFHSRSKLLIEPFRLQIGYIYNFFITKIGKDNHRFGISIEQDSGKLDGRILYRFLFGENYTDLRSRYSIEIFTSYAHYKNAKTIENESDKIYYGGMAFNTTNRANDFMQGYNALLTYKCASSLFFGLYDFHKVSFDYDYVYYYSINSFNKFGFNISSLYGDIPSFINYSYGTYCVAVSDKKGNDRANKLLGFSFETGTTLMKNISGTLKPITIRRLHGSIFMDICCLGDTYNEFYHNYAFNVGFRLNAIADFQSFLPINISFDFAFPVDSIRIKDLYFRINIREVF